LKIVTGEVGCHLVERRKILGDAVDVDARVLSGFSVLADLAPVQQLPLLPIFFWVKHVVALRAEPVGERETARSERRWQSRASEGGQWTRKRESAHQKESTRVTGEK
jgi:hypothetical protein